MSYPNAKVVTYPAYRFIVKAAADGYDYDLAADYAQLSRAISQGVPGNIVVDMVNTDGTVTNVTIPGGDYPSGYTFLVQVSKVYDTGTTADSIIIYL